MRPTIDIVGVVVGVAYTLMWTNHRSVRSVGVTSIYHTIRVIADKTLSEQCDQLFIYAFAESAQTKPSATGSDDS